MIQDTAPNPADIPLDLNRNGYVANNPIGHTDLSGHTFLDYITAIEAEKVLGGTALGWLSAYIGGSIFYCMAAAGLCGPGAQQWAAQTDLPTAASQGAAIGAAAAALYFAFPSFALGLSALGMGVAAIGFGANPTLCSGLALMLTVAGGSGGMGPFSLPTPVLAVTNAGGTLALGAATIQVPVASVTLSAALSGLPVMRATDGGGGNRAASKKSNTTGDPISPPTYPGELRTNMERAGITAPPEYQNPQVHHNFPWVMRDWFAERGIYVNDFDFGRWVEGTQPGPHQNWSREYQLEWESFQTRNPMATQQEIFDELGRLLASGRFPAK